MGMLSQKVGLKPTTLCQLRLRYRDISIRLGSSRSKILAVNDVFSVTVVQYHDNKYRAARFAVARVVSIHNNVQIT